MDAPTLQKSSLGDYPGSKMSLSNLEFWMFTSIILCPSGIFEGVEELIVIVFLRYNKNKVDTNIVTIILT